MKKCSRCAEEKEESAFNKRTDRPGTLQSYCKACNSQSSKAYYAKNKERHREVVRKRNAAESAKVRAIVDEIKASPCLDCGRCFPPEAMDFDHLGAKKSNVSHLIANSYCLETVMEEIAKCQLVCACCHRIRTKKRRTPL